MRRLEFHISYQCVNNCCFCSESQQLIKFRDSFIPISDIFTKLKKFSKKGFEHITFTGGEPTYHPYFIEILKFAKKLGYKTYLTTNGGLFSLKKFTRESLPYLDEICFSIHGHNAKLHDLHTRCQGSFTKLSKALINVERLGKDTFGFANIVVTKYNFDFLRDIIKFIGGYKKIKQILISNFAPEGEGLSNFTGLVVPLSRIRDKVNDIVNWVKSQSITVRFFGVPLCALKDNWNYSNDVYWSPRSTIEQWKTKRKTFLKKTLSYKPVRGRVKIGKCRQCLKKDICGGLFKKYYQEFGGHELTPFKIIL